MITSILFSNDAEPLTWSEAHSLISEYGPKGAVLATLPRLWTPPFALIAASVVGPSSQGSQGLVSQGDAVLERLRSLGGPDLKLIVRSSVVGETIWDRGSYKSELIDADKQGFKDSLAQAVARVIASAEGKQVGLVVQRFVSAKTRGEFGNLLRVSKTRDHWELSSVFGDGTQARLRFNTQRDQAASARHAIEIRSGQSRERLFGSVAAWLNNELARGQGVRLTCEWVTDNKHLYLVQVDQEDEDINGVNPFQLRVGAVHRPDPTAAGSFFQPATGPALHTWDKLRVLEELWEEGAKHKPTLFYMPLSALPEVEKPETQTALEQDFRSLIGPDNIIVRVSVRAGAEKVPNLPRTECVDPAQAAAWCLAERVRLVQGEVRPDDLAFVAHRFVPAPVAAWARAEPDNPVVEVHGLWGLPDALQYCPYDIWEVHIPTGVSTDYADYKSNMLIPREGSGWEYVRVKNELARALSIGRREAVDVANRTAVIARQLGRACHIMWFVGCTDWEGERFNLPWYWTEAHPAEKNIDRNSYRVFRITDAASLGDFMRHEGPRTRQALELSPTDLDLMRDTKFIEAVGKAAKDAGVPVILAGSTLAHAYFQLRKQGCAVISPGEKDHSRVRRSTVLGKLVRDKIPARITQRQEAELTLRVPNESIKGFLTSKLLEEALEVRNAEGSHEKTIELADLYEVVRALTHAEGLSLDDVVAAANLKRAQAGGFENGQVLMQTAILGRDRSAIQESARAGTQVLGHKISENEFEIPFTFFGFAEMDQPRSFSFGGLGIRVDIILKADRVELRASKEAEQLDLPLDLTVEVAGPSDE